MKKIAAILLLGILTFNWFGFRLLSNYMQYRTDAKLEAALDNEDYNEEDLIELKVPVSLPYQSNWDKFERYNGEIEIEGVHYKYVKRRVYNDSLILMCLPNEQKTQIENAKDNFFKLVNDLQSNHSKKSSEKGENLSFKNLLSEYYFNEDNQSDQLVIGLNTAYQTGQFHFLSLNCEEVSEQPPEC